ncbi:DUF6968 family protein [Edaphosphingomonas haloaromaticamans]|uniref:DUF6968 family protein n=1 Tax=Edaphosphingomonas haloaromaticamans TaxID=653954 RepID=UPI001113CE07|nr:hypothetical protein [Sphingomonas haloaromaticamans]
MTDHLVDNVIATRELELNGSGKVTIVIGTPFAVDEAREEFWCHYQIIGVGAEKIKHGIGADTFQALCVTLYKVSHELYFSDEYQKGDLKWEGGMTIADLGLPVSDGMIEDVKAAKSRVEALGSPNAR